MRGNEEEAQAEQARRALDRGQRIDVPALAPEVAEEASQSVLPPPFRSSGSAQACEETGAQSGFRG